MLTINADDVRAVGTWYSAQGVRRTKPGQRRLHAAAMQNLAQGRKPSVETIKSIFRTDAVARLISAGMCAGVVSGILETLRMLELSCPPEGVTNDQLVRMVVAEIERHPEKMHEDFIVPASAVMMVPGPVASKGTFHLSRVIALTAMVASLLPMQATAGDPALMLACKGTASMTSSTGGVYDTGPVSMGLVVDLTTRTVHGFREQFDTDGSEAQLKIAEVKEAIFILSGQMGSIIDLSGFMDRMTGDMTVTAT